MFGHPYWGSSYYGPSYWGPASGVVTPPVTPPVADEPRAKRGRRYRIIEDPDLICEEIQREEVKVEQEKKKLRILVKQSKRKEGPIYGLVIHQEKIQKLEAKIDNRLQRIEALNAMIQVKLAEQQEDDEEVLLMS